MQRKLLRSVRVRIRYFDKKLVEESLRGYLNEMVEKHPEVERELLFGSFVQNESVPGSDIDLLVLLSESEEPFMERIPRFLPSRFPVGVDVFPYTAEGVERMKCEGNSFIRRALEEGVEVFRKERRAL
ncbi:MAG: nucleotidyltransferase domain-containing protein [Methanosarcinales archaeon]|nr:nucleotidyltransferase domain-containing protein [Methanosarcinales archaeon]